MAPRMAERLRVCWTAALIDPSSHALRAGADQRTSGVKSMPRELAAARGTCQLAAAARRSQANRESNRGARGETRAECRGAPAATVPPTHCRGIFPTQIVLSNSFLQRAGRPL